MKKRRLLIAAIAICLAGVVAAHADEAFKSLAPGLEYRHDVRTNGPLSIHVLRIDRQQKWDFQTGLGQGTVYGLESLDGIVARVATQVKKPAVAAINGDFFVIKPGPYQGDPRGLQIAQGELVSRPTGTAFWGTPSGELKIGWSAIVIDWHDLSRNGRIGEGIWLCRSSRTRWRRIVYDLGDGQDSQFAVRWPTTGHCQRADFVQKREDETMRLQASLLNPPASSASPSFALGAEVVVACFAFATSCFAACWFTVAVVCGAW